MQLTLIKISFDMLTAAKAFELITKGQLISKCLFGVIVSTKIVTKILYEFLPWKFL